MTYVRWYNSIYQVICVMTDVAQTSMIHQTFWLYVFWNSFSFLSLISFITNMHKEVIDMTRGIYLYCKNNTGSKALMDTCLTCPSFPFLALAVHVLTIGPDTVVTDGF